MRQQNWLAQLAKRRVLWSVIHCMFWAALAILSWKHDPSGMIVWISLVFFVVSLYMLRLEVVSQRIRNPPSEQK
jgi:hypothetical protein